MSRRGNYPQLNWSFHGLRYAVIEECIDPSAGTPDLEPFTMLDGTVAENERLLASGAKRFLITYDLMVRQQSTLSAYLSRKSVHVVLDEAHRMKAGFDSQRGSFLLNVSPTMVGINSLNATSQVPG